MYVPFQAVHGPLEVPDVYRDMYQHVADEDRRTYLGMVTAMDDAVGNITQSLIDNGLYDNTIILWFSDNGGPAANWPPGHGTSYGANNWPLRGSKFTMWEGGSRTPAMLHSPAYLPQGTRNDVWMHVTDWYPTILAMAGLTSDQSDLDGYNQWSQLQDNSNEGLRQDMVYNLFYPTFVLGDLTPIGAIRKGKWKYIKRTIGFQGWTPCPPEACSNYTMEPDTGDNQELLFDIEADIRETTNLIESEPAIAEDLRMMLEQHLAALPDDIYPADDPAGDPANYGGVWSDGWC